MGNGIEKAVHGSQSDHCAPGVHPQLFSFEKNNAFIENEGQENKQPNKIAKEDHCGIINRCRGITDTHAHN